MTRDSKSLLYVPGDADHVSIEPEIEIEIELKASNALSCRSEPPADAISAAGPSGAPLILDTLPSFSTGCRVIPLHRNLWPQVVQSPMPSRIVDVVKVWWPDDLES